MYIINDFPNVKQPQNAWWMLFGAKEQLWAASSCKAQANSVRKILSFLRSANGPPCQLANISLATRKSAHLLLCLTCDHLHLLSHLQLGKSPTCSSDRLLTSRVVGWLGLGGVGFGCLALAHALYATLWDLGLRIADSSNMNNLVLELPDLHLPHAIALQLVFSFQHDLYQCLDLNQNVVTSKHILELQARNCPAISRYD